ncbi:MAG: haloacid dehalogenase [Pseudopedobacter saltans]|uniref:Haloacid dehalogenase n=1 Tax=Pseudopedobacter saltans TaxID=151895 RepID=A0A2W5F6P9_9SPHI|nr:MAG: haloacid dehalogenase [Pseudopedobacter saltans]
MRPAAFLFDMNGTMIDDMHYHQKAWYDIFTKELGSDISEEAAKHEMYGKNAEVLERVFGKNRFTAEEIADIENRKELRYQEVFRPHLQLLPGLSDFLQKAKDNHIALAISTAAPQTNIDYVLDNITILKSYFPVVVGADNVKASKPDPEVFLKCAEELAVNPADCIVLEDSPKGVEAARNGGMKAIVLLTFHEPEDFTGLDNILMMVKDYNDPQLTSLF